MIYEFFDRAPTEPRDVFGDSSRVHSTVFAFILCYCVENYISFCQICPLILVDVVLLFLLINAASNPLAYALLKKDIRTEVKAMFTCNIKCNLVGNK